MDVKVENNVKVVGKGSRTEVVLMLGNRLATKGDWEAWVNCSACAREDDGEESVREHSCRSVGSGAVVEGIEVGTSSGVDGEVEVKK
jgi:hypothetical protein